MPAVENNIHGIVHVHCIIHVQCISSSNVYILYMYNVQYVHGKYVYSTLALGKEREIVKEETALRKEKEAVCCYVHVHVLVH